MCLKRFYGKYLPTILFNTEADNESERKINLVEVQQLDNLDVFRFVLKVGVDSCNKT